jgi:hypothetical protein
MNAASCILHAAILKKIMKLETVSLAAIEGSI